MVVIHLHNGGRQEQHEPVEGSPGSVGGEQVLAPQRGDKRRGLCDKNDQKVETEAPESVENAGTGVELDKGKEEFNGRMCIEVSNASALILGSNGP